MKKLLSFALVLMMVFALAVPVMAVDARFVKDSTGPMWTLYVGDEEFRFRQSDFNENSILTVTLADGSTFKWSVKNNAEYVEGFVCPGHVFVDTDVVLTEPTCTVDGLLKTVCSVPGCDATSSRVIPALGHLLDWVIVSETATGLTVEKTNGNTNNYVFATAIYSENVCKRDGCGHVEETKTENSSITLVLANNYKGIVTVVDSTVSIDVKGNTDVRVFEVLGKK